MKALTGLDVERHKSGVLTDGRYPGLRLVATPGARAGAPLRSWIYRYRRHDRTRGQIKLGEYPAMSLAEARKAWETEKAVRDDPARGDPRAERMLARAAAEARRTKAYTVREMLKDHAEHHLANLAKGHEQERMLRQDVLPVLGNRVAAEVTGREVVDLFEKIAKRAPHVARLTLAALRKAFSVAIDRRRIEGPNPCLGVKSAKYVRRDRALSDAELRSLLMWLPSSPYSRSVRDGVRLQLLTAARSGEIVAAEWSEIDLEAGVWTQPKSKTKNKRQHRVMLPSQAVELLKARRGLHARWVFPSIDNRHLLQKAIGFAQYEARKVCPVKGWTIHDLRRSALTGLARLGCPRVIQDRIANHVDNSIGAIYDRHDYDAEARAWLQQWADHLDILLAGENVISMGERARAA